MRFAKTVGVAMAAALLLGGPGVAMAAGGRWIKTGPGNSGIFETSSGYQEYMPARPAQLPAGVRQVGNHYELARPAMNAAQQQTGAHIAAAAHKLWEHDWV